MGKSNRRSSGKRKSDSRPKWEHGMKLLAFLKQMGLEPDQRMMDALRIASPAGLIDDGYLLQALCRLNARGTQYIPRKILALDSYTLAIPEGKPTDLSELLVRERLARVLERLWESGANQRTLGASDFLRCIISDAERYGEDYLERGFAVDALMKALGLAINTALSKAPAVQRLLRRLESAVDGTDDYQYALLLGEGGLRFRVVSVLSDHVQRGDSGLWVPSRSLLTHLGEIGVFAAEQIRELEELINNPKAKEDDFQKFFERYPHFLRKWDYREVHPHVYLAREDQGPLIPDFILTNKDTQKAAILELKLAQLKRKLVKGPDNRKRFSDAVMEARAQLLKYRDWFDIPQHREMLKSKVDMEIYRPRLMVIIGRASEFVDGIERQELQANTGDIEIVTYDDILRDAEERKVIVEQGRALYLRNA
ncbi:MAG: Shedu anti-phage system protein SduA domain-containing protein [Planctomycetota bacterium]